MYYDMNMGRDRLNMGNGYYTQHTPYPNYHVATNGYYGYYDYYNYENQMVYLRSRSRVAKQQPIEEEQIEEPIEDDVTSSDDDYDVNDDESACTDTSRQQRELMRPWLIKQIGLGRVPGLEWLDKQKTLIKIPWTHGSRHGFDLKKDSCLFQLWAVHTGKFKNSTKGSAKRWKANFRCAMNSLLDVKEEKLKSKTKGAHAYKVYRLLPTKVRKGNGRRKNGGSKGSAEASYKNYTTNADRMETLRKLRQKPCESASSYFSPSCTSSIEQPLLFSSSPKHPSASPWTTSIEQPLFSSCTQKVVTRTSRSGSVSTCTNVSDVSDDSGHMTETSSDGYSHMGEDAGSDCVVPGYKAVTPYHVSEYNMDTSSQHVPAGYSPHYTGPEASPNHNMYSSSPATGYASDFSKEHSYAAQAGPIPSVVESQTDESDVEWNLNHEHPLHINRIWEKVDNIISQTRESRRTSIEQLFSSIEANQDDLTPHERLFLSGSISSSLATTTATTHISMETASQCSSSVGYGSEGGDVSPRLQDMHGCSSQDDSGIDEMLSSSQGSMSQLLNDSGFVSLNGLLDCGDQNFPLSDKVTVEQMPYSAITSYSAVQSESLVPLAFEKM